MKRNLARLGLLIAAALSVTVVSAEPAPPSPRITLGAVDLAACVCFHPLTADFILLRQALDEPRGGVARVLSTASELKLRRLEDRLDQVEDLLDRAGADHGGDARENETSGNADGPRMVTIDLTDVIRDGEETAGDSAEPGEPIDTDLLSAERYSLLEKIEKTRSEVRYLQVPEAERQLAKLKSTIKSDILASFREACRENGIDAGVNFAVTSINTVRPLVYYPPADPAEASGPEPDAGIEVIVPDDPSLMLHYSEIFWSGENENTLRERLGHELAEIPEYLSLFRNYIGTRLFMFGEEAAPFKNVFLTELVIAKLLKQYRLEAERAQVIDELLATYFDSAPAEEETEDIR